MHPEPAVLQDEARCRELESFLAARIYEFNALTTGYVDGRLLAASIHDDVGQVIAGLSGHTWGGCCELSYVWVHEEHRNRGLGSALLRAAEAEARSRGCEQVVLATHSFQAPKFYERMGYVRKFVIEGRPRGYSNIIYVKLLPDENGA